MPEVAVTSGTFGWTDLMVPDPGGVKGFYQDLFGWSARDEPAGEMGTYTLFMKDGKDVAGLMAQSPEETGQGIPPMWNSYVSVDDVDALANRVADLGGTVLVPPFDVMEDGRMTVIQDPTGGTLSLWQPKGHSGAGLFNEHGTLTWNELATRDREGAVAFYGELLGWSFDEMETPAGLYKVIMNDGRPNGGILQMNDEWPEGIPAHWMVYFAVDDVEAAARSVEELGGSISVPPTDIQVGIMSVVGDPAGGTFTLFKAHPQPEEGS